MRRKTQSFPHDVRATQARTSMRRVVSKLHFEHHPLVNRPVCAIVYQGEVLHFDRPEIEGLAKRALAQMLTTIPIDQLPHEGLEAFCRRRLIAYAASHVPNGWTI